MTHDLEAAGFSMVRALVGEAERSVAGHPRFTPIRTARCRSDRGSEDANPRGSVRGRRRRRAADAPPPAPCLEQIDERSAAADSPYRILLGFLADRHGVARGGLIGGSSDPVPRARRSSVRLDFPGSRPCGFRVLCFVRVLRRSPASDLELPLQDRADRADNLTMHRSDASRITIPSALSAPAHVASAELRIFVLGHPWAQRGT